jgi:hypothetical protein
VRDFAEAGALAEALALDDDRRRRQGDDGDARGRSVRGFDVRAEEQWRRRLFGKLTRYRRLVESSKLTTGARSTHQVTTLRSPKTRTALKCDVFSPWRWFF